MGQVIEFVHSQIDCLLSKHSIITHGTTEFHSILRSRERQTGDGHVYFEKKKTRIKHFKRFSFLL